MSHCSTLAEGWNDNADYRMNDSGSKAWKTLNLSGLPDSSEDEKTAIGTQTGPHGSTKDKDKREVTSTSYGASQMPVSTLQNPMDTSVPSSLHGLPGRNYDSTRWDPGAPSFKPAEMHTSKKLKENVTPYAQSSQPSKCLLYPKCLYHVLR